jgi:hypothetical protein
MGWFGILADTSRDEDKFNVAACHLNWWTLPTFLPGRRLFFLDIGLHVNAPAAKDLNSITVALPIDVESVRWKDDEPTWTQDLYDALRLRDVCSQVFGERVSVGDTSTGYRIDRTSGSHLDVVRTLVAQAVPLDSSRTSRSDLSIWTIPLESPIPARDSRYVRFRVSVFTTGTVWRWKKVWFGKSGAQIDLRVSDVREAMRDERERQYWSRVVPIEQLNVFFIIPSAFQARVASPALHYVRILEAGQWGRYLQGIRYRARAHSLRVHYWRHPAEAPLVSLPPSGTSTVAPPTVSTTHGQSSPITIDEPFRAFLDLSRDIAIPTWVSVLRTILSVIAATLIIRLGIYLHSIRFPTNIHIRTIVFWITGSTLIAVLTALGAYVRMAKSRLRTIRLVLRRVERSLLKPFTRT